MDNSSVPMIVLSFLLFTSVIGDISQKLHYFETLKSSDISRRMRRSADPNPNTHYQEIRLSTLGRHFHMYLKSFSILADDARLESVGPDGQTREFTLNANDFLKGSLKDDDESEVHAHWEDDALLAEIHTADNVYTIEPAWRHLENSPNHSMIAYRQSDIKWHKDHWNKAARCPGGVHEGPEGVEPTDSENTVEFEQMTSDGGHSRKRRRTSAPYVQTRTTCRLMVIADNVFHESVGGGIKHRTASYIIGLMNKVESLYRNTKWNEEGTLTNLGFEIAGMKIHEDIETDPSHYNYRPPPGFRWDTKKLLTAFSTEKYLDKFCLGHLFTCQAFEKGVLGLAYIASHRLHTVGGICSPLYHKRSLNTGWSSAMNTQGQRILSQEATLVTSHGYIYTLSFMTLFCFLGHNWGSEHDPQTDDCAPSGFHGGKYLMYPYAVSGYESNNKIFSPCSRGYVFKVVKSKGYSCFSEKRSDVPFCGNGRVDGGEECDGGFREVNEEDRCCSSKCKLKPGAQCSPMNNECCSNNCTLARKGHVCRVKQDDGTCKGEARCDGNLYTCPEPEAISDVKCLDGGTCKNGTCLDICQLEDMDPCICPPESGKSCYRCCRKRIAGSTCELHKNMVLPDGRPCYQGFCEKGICKKENQDLVQRFFSIIEDITVDQLVEFMRSNIVGTVIVLSLIIWIPASCIFSYFDKKNDRKDLKKKEWMSRMNRTLLCEKDEINCRTASTRRLHRTNSNPYKHKPVHMQMSNPLLDSDRETNV
ncbi:hypothetical protein ScPMuIL_003622 [Solemya velum]